MKNKIASKAVSQFKQSDQNTQQLCNYNNNYYGDQVCILVKKAGKTSWALKSSFYFLVLPWITCESLSTGPADYEFNSIRAFYPLPTHPLTHVGNIPIGHLLKNTSNLPATNKFN